VEFVVTGSDLDNDLEYCDMGIGGYLAGRQYFSSSNSGATCTFTYTFTNSGSYSVWFQAFDMLHNPGSGARCTVNVISPPLNTNLTVLTYNTHLFEDSPVECIVKSGEFWTGGTEWADYSFEDWDRLLGLTLHLGGVADIVALEEVWAVGWRQVLQGVLGYRYSYLVDSSANCRAGLKAYNAMLPANIDAIGLKELRYPVDYDHRCQTLGNGLLLLSKYPLSDTRFARFPTYTQSPLDQAASSDVWADKGVLAATADVGGTPIRVGISHALCGWDDYYSQWINTGGIIPDTVTTFQDRKGQAYFFWYGNGAGSICRFEDYSYSDETGKVHPAVGVKPVYWTNMTYPCVAATAFEMNGAPYLLTVHPGATNTTRIWRFNDDPATGWGPPTPPEPLSPGASYKHPVSFQLNGQPHIAIVRVAPDYPDYAAILRINPDATGWTKVGSAGGELGKAFVSLAAYEVNGRPYLFVNLTNNVPYFYQEADIYQIQDDGWAAFIDSLVTSDPLGGMLWWSMYTSTAFNLNGRGFIFFHTMYSRNGAIAEMDPSVISLENVPSWNPGLKSWAAVRSFQLDGHPYLFGLRNCCQQEPDITQARPRPGDAFIWRVNDDGKGLEPVLQLEDIRLIRDATVLDPDGPPAIMMGDFNIHEDKYPHMNEIFRKVGAVDAYVKVHGTATGGETLDWFQNPLLMYFWRTNAQTDISGLVSRIDYVYVKQYDGSSPSKGGSPRVVLEPVDAHVIRDWKLPGSYFDLSDHYPLFVKFRLQEGSRLEASPLADGRCQLSLTGTIGRNCELQRSSDLLVWEKVAEVRLTNSPTLYVPPGSPATGRRFYRLRLLP